MYLSQLLTHLSYTASGAADAEITDIVYDSRKARPGTVFVCLKGYTSDGHRFANAAVEQGVSALVISDDLDFAPPAEVAVIKTADTRRALALMSAELFGNPADELKTVAITGTKGKTTTTAMIAEIFEHAGIKTGTIGTLGIVYDGKTFKTDNTTPESYEIQKAMRDMLNAGCGAMVIEASSIGLKHHRLDGMTFDVGIFTNFSHDHIGGVEHKDMEEYLACKSLLFRQVRHAAANCDDAQYRAVTKDFDGELHTFGFSEQAQLRAKNERLLSEGGFIGVHFETEGAKTLSLDVGVPGVFNVYNASRSGDHRRSARRACQGQGGAGQGAGQLQPADRLCPQRAVDGKRADDPAPLPAAPSDHPVRRRRQPSQGAPLRDGRNLRQTERPLGHHRGQLAV